MSWTGFWPKWLAGFMFVFGCMALAAPAAKAETRTLKLYFVHTKERAEITFKRNGRYDQAGLKQINNFLRDWRRNEPTRMDPRLLDLVWETYQASGAKDYIHVVSGYRSPATNSMLRSRSKGVANKSQHMLGKAMDFYIPGVPLKKLRDTGLRMQVGGVGYYPTSGSPFVHFDVGNVRHWPRMSRSELVAVFPNGKTLHVPSDGKPLPGYEQAVASYEARKKNGTSALALASAAPAAKSGKSGGLLARLFGGGADEEEDNSESAGTIAVASAAPASARNAPKPSGEIQIVPPELAQPATAVAADDDVVETPVTILAALPERSIPLPVFAPRPQAEVGPVETVAVTAVQNSPAEPADMPFGRASAAPVEEPEFQEDMAMVVPLPTWRPDTEGEGAPSQLVLAPPTPESRPALEPVPEQVAAASPDGIDDILAEDDQRQGRLSPGRSAERTQQKVAAVAPDAPAAKTTRKGDRATNAAKATAKPKPQVVAAQPETARWALGSEPNLAYDAAGTSVARLMVGTAPSEVFATGFQRDTVVADASRFTGKAVSFIPVARFQSTN